DELEAAWFRAPSTPGPRPRMTGPEQARDRTGTGLLSHQFLVACGAHLAPIPPAGVPPPEVLVTALAGGVVADPDRFAWAPLHLPADDGRYPGPRTAACQLGRGVAPRSLTLVPSAR